MRGSATVREVTGGRPVRWQACGADGGPTGCRGRPARTGCARATTCRCGRPTSTSPARGRGAARTRRTAPGAGGVPDGRPGALADAGAPGGGRRRRRRRSWWSRRTSTPAGRPAPPTARLLVPVRVEGWKQAWLLPAGRGGEVRLDYAPAPLYRWGLVGGGVRRAPARRPGGSRDRSPAQRRAGPAARASRRDVVRRWRASAGSSACSRSADRRRCWCSARWRPSRRRLRASAPLVAGGALLLSGLVTASARQWTWPWASLPTATAHVLGVLAVGVAVLSLGPARRDDAPAPPPAGAPARTSTRVTTSVSTSTSGACPAKRSTGPCS